MVCSRIDLIQSVVQVRKSHHNSLTGIPMGQILKEATSCLEKFAMQSKNKCNLNLSSVFFQLNGIFLFCRDDEYVQDIRE